MCCLAALAPFIGSYQRRKLPDPYTTIMSLALNGWRHLELLAGEAFRSQGYLVEEASPGGVDGSFDLIRRKDGCRVRCSPRNENAST